MCRECGSAEAGPLEVGDRREPLDGLRTGRWTVPWLSTRRTLKPRKRRARVITSIFDGSIACVSCSDSALCFAERLGPVEAIVEFGVQVARLKS